MKGNRDYIFARSTNSNVVRCASRIDQITFNGACDRVEWHDNRPP